MPGKHNHPRKPGSIHKAVTSHKAVTNNASTYAVLLTPIEVHPDGCMQH